jgi:hypothetical protein
MVDMAQYIPPDSIAHRRPHRAPRRPPEKKHGFSALVIGQWVIVLGLAAGLTMTLLTITSAPDPKTQAANLVIQIKAAALGRPMGDPVLATLPTAVRNKQVAVVSIDKVPKKVCVMVAWDLYRFGTITINGTTPNRVSAERLAELCNEYDMATMTWTARMVN